METIDIKYQFFFNDGSDACLNLRLHPKTLEIMPDKDQASPDWAELEFNQCSHCPLAKENSPHCPVALNLVSVFDIFNRILSYEEFVIEVTTEERTVRQKTSAQRVASSLMGLLIGASGCPHTAFFKSMARYHLPLASQEETIFRAASAYLIAQYLLHENMANFSFAGLDQIYQNMQVINSAVAKRLRSAVEADSMLNAIAILDLNAQVMPMVIEDTLDDVRYVFEPYLKVQNAQSGS